MKTKNIVQKWGEGGPVVGINWADHRQIRPVRASALHPELRILSEPKKWERLRRSHTCFVIQFCEQQTLRAYFVAQKPMLFEVCPGPRTLSHPTPVAVMLLPEAV